MPDVDSLLCLDHISGLLTWKPRVNNNRFNTRSAGKLAGCKHPTGYIYLSIFDKTYLAHRVVWFIYYGVDPGKYMIDHIDGNKNNNCILNLRLANNSFNISARSATKGYFIDKGTYRAKITINGVLSYLGSYNRKLK